MSVLMKTFEYAARGAAGAVGAMCTVGAAVSAFKIATDIGFEPKAFAFPAVATAMAAIYLPLAINPRGVVQRLGF